MMRKARHLIELWQSIGLGRVPTRDRFKPNNFPMLLPSLFGADVAERLEDFTISLAGNTVEKSYGRPLLGVSFAELDLGPRKEEIVEEYKLCASKRVAIASRHQMRMVDEGVLELQRVLLPFDSLFKSGVSHVIGWCHMSPAPKRGINGAVVRWTTEERHFIPAGA